MSAFTLLSVSCTKPVNDTPLPTDLIGSWNFKSLTYNTKTITKIDGCTQASVLIPNTAYLKLSLKNVTATKMTLYSECNGDNREYNYTFDGTTINCEEGSRIFTIKSLIGNELQLYFQSAAANGLPVGGTYTFTK